MKCSFCGLLAVVATVIAACASSHIPPAASASSAPMSLAVSPPSDGLAGFEWRRTHSGGGHFLSGESIRSVPDASLISVLRMKIPGFTTQRGALPLLSLSEPCSLETYVNGLWAPDAADDLSARNVEAVEYYEATTAPPRYRRAGHACPVLLVWLRP